ncbi:MAG TPA: hypothetical protein DDY98_00615 [Ruminococcaceae bacterium]|nr:hypothetical protein [Oscillospiraceae bacterium]
MAFNYDNVKDRKLYNILKPLGWCIMHLLYSYKVVGKENVPKDGSFILTCNHIHFMDPVLLIVNAPRKIHFMGKNEAFKRKFASWFLTSVNTFPVARGRNDKAAVNYAIKLIETGHVIGIFPEGTRSKDLKPHEAKAGVSLIARQTKADILPASIYCEKAKGLRRKMTIRFGEVIPYESLGITEDGSSRELREAAARIMAGITDLWEEGHCR